MSFARNGYVVTDLVLSAAACDSIASELPCVGSRRGGIRNVLRFSVVRDVLENPRFADAVRKHADGPLVAVKATLFDKTRESNWRVQWHQDRIVTLEERMDVPGFERWTRKDGALHADAPREVLERMLAVRIHLDAASHENGPLRVIPGSHGRGKIPEEKIPQFLNAGHVELCVPKGAVLLMRPLLLHSSAPAEAVAHRRVLHIELGPPDLPGGLRWSDAFRS